MNSLLSHLVVFAKLLGVVVSESWADPHAPTAITVDRTGKIGAQRLPRAAVPRPAARHSLHPAHPVG
jgi:hypothetical protein